MKRIFTILCLIWMVSVEIAFAKSGYILDGIFYWFDEESQTAEVGANGYSGTIVIPSSVTFNYVDYNITRIGEGAFYECSDLTNVEMPNSITSIGERAFYGCSGLTSVTIPNSVTNIEEEAFYSCTGLSNIDITNSVTTIGERAFADCISITSVIVGYNVERICGDVFSGCNIENVVWNARNCTVYCPIGDEYSYGYTLPFEASRITSFTFGDEVEIIPSHICESMYNLTSIAIPESATSIEENAFYGCNGLTTITIPENVTSIGDEAFSSCSNLTSIIMGNGVISIGSRTFYNCASLAAITLPNSVQSIGDGAFAYCSKLTSIIIPQSVTSIGNISVFGWCDKLTSISVENGNIVYDSRNNCNAIIETASNLLVAGCKTTSIPASVTTIGRNSFIGLRGITSIEIPEGVTRVEDNAYYSTRDCISIHFPSTLTYIGMDAFATQNHRKTIICEAITPPATASRVFPNIFIYDEVEPCSLYVHGAGLYNYVNADVWNEFNIVADFSDTNDNTSVFADMIEMGSDNPEINFELGRTLYKDGYYNTICLPFGLDELTGTPLEGATIKEFVSASVSGEYLDINVASASTIEAGKPYLVSFASGENLINPIFENVTITASVGKTIDGGAIDFKGVLKPTDLETDNHDLLFLGANNQLFWPNVANPIRGYRAYFEATSSGPASAPVRRGMKSRIVEQQNEVTDLASKTANTQLVEKRLVNGEIIISRGNASYNLLGMVVH